MRIAAVYRQRWTIENAFQELDQALSSEINTLCYPKAALLCFCVGVVLYNMLSVLKSAIAQNTRMHRRFRATTSRKKSARRIAA